MVMGIMAQWVTQREDPFAVRSSCRPMVEQGKPFFGWIRQLQSVTPDPVSNRALNLSPPIETSAFGREYSALVI